MVSQKYSLCRPALFLRIQPVLEQIIVVASYNSLPNNAAAGLEIFKISVTPENQLLVFQIVDANRTLSQTDNRVVALLSNHAVYVEVV